MCKSSVYSSAPHCRLVPPHFGCSGNSTVLALNLTQTLTLALTSTLILTQYSKSNSNDNLKNKKEQILTRAQSLLSTLFAFLFSLNALCNVLSATFFLLILGYY